MSKGYTSDYKKEAVKLSKQIGATKASQELGVAKNTLYNWIRAERSGEIDLGRGSRTPKETQTLAEELQESRKKIKALEKENALLRKERDFLDDASRFFAAGRKK